MVRESEPFFYCNIFHRFAQIRTNETTTKMEICSYGLDSHLSDYYYSFVFARSAYKRSSITVKNINTHLNYGAFNGVCADAKSSKINGKMVV